MLYRLLISILKLPQGSNTKTSKFTPGGGGSHICAIRRRAADQGILFDLRIRDRVSFFEPDSKTGCQICTITPSQGAYSQYCHSTVWHPPIGFNLFVFCPGNYPSFDIFNIFKVLIWHTVQEFLRVSFENNSFLCFDTLFR